MFTEILRIKPLLDKAAAAAMDQQLHKRFASIATRFGQGLKAVVKGSVIGISLGLLAKILNPLQELEDKIKSLLGQGEDLRNLADEFGTTPGSINRLQALGTSVGLKPEDLQDLLKKFKESIDEARLGQLNPEEPLSPKARAVAKFANQQDIAEAFFKFIQSLKEFGNKSSPELNKFLQDKSSILEAASANRISGKPLTDEQANTLLQLRKLEVQGGGLARRETETNVFGAPLFGAARRFVEQDALTQQAKLQGLPNSGAVSAAANRLAGFDEKASLLDTVNKTNDFVNAGNTINGNMIAAMARAEKRDEDFKTKQLAQFESLSKGAQAVVDLQEGLQNALGLLTTLVGHLGVITNFIPKLTSTRWWNNIGGRKE